ncbi:MAG: PAS-domain containing protein [Rhodoplanes sp.]|uniref:PAS-domain containing protein n=1 Tax=Rhodoplanes sp. TaxID=1968906 RepID=UPI00182B341C|nr:PAS-domain containing protein [Rhodoplanes sp.]NVO14334.1 PAS-domain containing protein [Rhodoplanes sp.]
MLIALLTIVAVSAIAQQATLRELIRNSERGALNVERINGLVYATVMESRGIYMSPDAAAAKRFADGVTRFTDEIGKVTSDWSRMVRADDAVRFAGFHARVEQFRAFRKELVRRAVDLGPLSARKFGDDEAARAVRVALNQDLEALSRVYQARVDEIERQTASSILISWSLALTATVTLVLLIAGAFMMHRSVVKPLTEIKDATLAIAAGLVDAKTPHTDRPDEIGALAGAIEVFKSTMQRNGVLDAESAAAVVERNLMLGVIRLQKRHLDTALDNMAHGLLVVDRSMRLVFCNKRYLEIYGLPADAAEPGLRLDGLLRRQIKAGTFCGDIAAFIRWMADGKVTSGDLELTGGRTIRICNRTLEEGGWVATHEDITEQRRAERALECTERFLGTVIENVPEAIIVKDARSLRYVLLNQAADALFGVPRSDIIGKTAREIFPAAAAEIIESHDRAMVAAGHMMEFPDHEIDTPRDGRRTIVSRRLPIYGQAGEVTFLLSVVEDRTAKAAAAPLRLAAAE